MCRHCERTRALVYVIDMTKEDPSAELDVLIEEVGLYDEALLAKVRIFSLSLSLSLFFLKFNTFLII